MAEPGSWDLLDEDCVDISDWADNDTDAAVSEVSPAGQFRFDTNTGAAGNAKAQRQRDIGAYPNTFTIEFKLYHDLIGTRSNNDFFNIQCRQVDEYLELRLASDGIFVADSDSGLTEVGTNLIKTSGSVEWQTWRFLVTYGTLGDGVCDVYLTDSTHDCELVGEAVPCSNEYGGTEGDTWLIQRGDTTNDMVTHVDYIKAATGLFPPNAYNLLDGKIKIKDSTTNLIDGKIYILDANLLDGKIQIKDSATNLLDGKARIKDSATNLLDGKARIKDSATNLLDGKTYITYTGQIDDYCPTPICAMSAVFRYARIEASPPVPTASFKIGRIIEGDSPVPDFTCIAYHGRNPSLIASAPCPTCSMRIGLSLSDIATISRKAGVPIPTGHIVATSVHLATMYGNTPCPLFTCDGDTENIAVISASVPSPTGLFNTTIGNVCTILGRVACPSCSIVALTGQVISLAGNVPVPGSLVRFYASLKNETITLVGTAPTPLMISKVHGLTSSVLRHVRGDVR